MDITRLLGGKLSLFPRFNVYEARRPQEESMNGSEAKKAKSMRKIKNRRRYARDAKLAQKPSSY